MAKSSFLLVLHVGSPTNKPFFIKIILVAFTEEKIDNDQNTPASDRI